MKKEVNLAKVIFVLLMVFYTVTLLLIKYDSYVIIIQNGFIIEQNNLIIEQNEYLRIQNTITI